MKTIMLICAAGMSTSMLVAKMQKAATDQNKEYEIFAISLSELDATLKAKKIDAVLLAPQVQYAKGEVEPKIKQAGIGFGSIVMADYGLMNGANVLKTAETLL